MVVIDRGRCDLCGTCIAVCPENALEIETALAVDPSACTGCNRCVTVCPFGALSRGDGAEKNKNGATPG
jgi:ferredoxin